MPKYRQAYQDGSLQKTADRASKILESCCLCPRKCNIDRRNKEGFCKTGTKARIYSYMPHHGEEPPISGKRGSGTIFFSGCNMACLYCQNYEFSQRKNGREVNKEELADIMLGLQALKCHNINLVTPTHVIPQILQALALACEKGLNLPLVYNTSGYESTKIIKMLAGIIDVYLADMRYADSGISKKYSSAPDYPNQNQKAIKEMHSQVGIAKFDNQGIIISGLIIRHLVMPGGISGTEKIMRFLKQKVSPDTYISLMSQYTPYNKTANFPEINRRPSLEEYEKATQIMQKYGLHNGWTQDAGGLAKFAGIYIKPNL